MGRIVIDWAIGFSKIDPTEEIGTDVERIITAQRTQNWSADEKRDQYRPIQ